MYSLLVSHQVAEREHGTFEIPRDRFLEYTSDSISNQLQILSVEAKGCIQSWPCLLMQEGRGREEEHLAAYGIPWPVAVSDTERGESGPPKLATERNASRDPSSARNSLSPVRIHSGIAAKTPRKRVNFSGCRQVQVGNLCSP